MPFIRTTTTEKINDETLAKITADFGRAIELIPGKSEKWLMLSFDGEKQMAFGGKTDSGMAIIEVQLLGTAERKYLDRLTEALTDIVSESLEIKPDMIYVNYTYFDTWGYNSSNL